MRHLILTTAAILAIAGATTTGAGLKLAIPANR